jgi:hypothetical protein
MLLFQFGTNNWGEGEFFNMDLSRQLRLDDSGDDESIWQLSLTFKFLPSDQLRSLGAGQKWCESPSELQAFDRYIQSSLAFQIVRDLPAETVDLDFECVG